jgi:hypothetical protein
MQATITNGYTSDSSGRTLVRISGNNLSLATVGVERLKTKILKQMLTSINNQNGLKEVLNIVTPAHAKMYGKLQECFYCFMIPLNMTPMLLIHTCCYTGFDQSFGRCKRLLQTAIQA